MLTVSLIGSPAELAAAKTPWIQAELAGLFPTPGVSSPFAASPSDQFAWSNGLLLKELSM